MANKGRHISHGNVFLVLVLIMALVFVPNSSMDEAKGKKPAIQKKVTLTISQKKKIRVTGIKKSNINKTVWRVKGRCVRLSAKKKNRVVLKAVSKGKARLRAKVLLKKKTGKRVYRLSCKITVKKAKKNAVTPVPEREGASLKDLYASSFRMGAAINGSSKETAAIRHEGMAAVLKKHYNSTTLSNLMKPNYLLDETACREAAEADEDTTDVAITFDSCEETLKFYNVFQVEKRKNICALLEKLKESGLVDGVGLQPTVLLDYPSELKGDTADSFENCLKAYGELGLEIQVTELSFEIKGTENRTEENMKRQADRYQEMFELLVDMDDDNGGPCNITSVSIFGICDDYPLYQNHEQCLYLWDKNCVAKEAFYRIREEKL